jgi:hypothetical protein
MTAVEELRAELRAACEGHPHAKIPWPHRLLHKADEALEAIEAELDGWRKIVGDIAALVPLPSVIKATGTTGDLIDWIKQQIAERAEAEARVTALEKALEPFAWFGEKNTDSTGWAGLRCERERINVWFGPSDFRNAFEASALSPKLGEERR